MRRSTWALPALLAACAAAPATVGSGGSGLPPLAPLAPPPPSSVASTIASAPSPVPTPPILPTSPDRADAIVWRTSALQSAAIVDGASLALTFGCALADLDPSTGALSNERALPETREGVVVRCEHRFAGDGLMLSHKDGSLDLVAPATLRVRVHVPIPPAGTRWLTAATRERLFVADRHGGRMKTLPPNVLHAVEGVAGTDLWTASLGQDEDPTAIVVTDGGVVVATATAGASTGTLSSFDATTGARRWRRTDLLGPTILGSDGRRILVRSSGLRLLDARTGADVWRFEVGQAEAIALGPQAAFVVERSTARDELVTLDLADGRVRTRTPLSRRITPGRGASVVPLSSRVFVRAGDALLAIDPAAGRELWSFAMARDPNRVVPLSSGGSLVLFLGDAPDGTVAFDPDAPLPLHDVEVRGVVRHGPGSEAKGRSLRGLEVHAAGASATVDATSHFALKLRGRGRVTLGVNDGAWIAANRQTKCPRGTYLCGDAAAETVDLEGPGAQRDVTMTWSARCCGIR